MVRKILAAAGLALLVSGCGYSQLDRGLSGSAIGAGVGAAASAASGGDISSGAILGGAVGAATGVLVDARNLDLGRPVWRR